MAVHEAKFDDSGNGTATSEPMSDKGIRVQTSAGTGPRRINLYCIVIPEDVKRKQNITIHMKTWHVMDMIDRVTTACRAAWEFSDI